MNTDKATEVNYSDQIVSNTDSGAINTPLINVSRTTKSRFVYTGLSANFTLKLTPKKSGIIITELKFIASETNNNDISYIKIADSSNGVSYFTPNTHFANAKAEAIIKGFT